MEGTPPTNFHTPSHGSKNIESVSIQLQEAQGHGTLHSVKSFSLFVLYNLTNVKNWTRKLEVFRELYDNDLLVI